MSLENEALKHVNKAKRTLEYLQDTRINDPRLDGRKKVFVQQDIDALKFLIEQAEENLKLKGVNV